MRSLRIIPLLFLLLSHSIAAEETEQLEYRLSYSGFVTGYIWKELADVTLNLIPEPTTFRDQPAARLSMEVTTANYMFAEAIHALRYRWESLLTPDLQRTLLVRVSDRGDSDSHEVYWYDWQNKVIEAFRKREQHDVSIPMFDETAILEWEQDRLPPAPPFIDPHPAVAPGLGYLLHTRHKEGVLTGDAIDPLAMLRRLRHHDYRSASEIVLPIIHENSLAPYYARLMATETLPRGECRDPALKIEIRRKDATGEAGVMTMWLSDDARHLPLRIDLDASLGMLHIELKTGLAANAPGGCKNNDATNATPSPEPR